MCIRDRLLFSTAPGRVALDGPSGESSPFAAALLRQLSGPSIDMTALPARLRRDLLLATEGQQVIWSESTYTQPFVFTSPRGGPAQASARPVDASRIVELPKAYAFARAKNLVLPEGLVAMRAPASSSHADKVGAFESTIKMQVGVSQSASTIEPILLIVLSVDDSGTAQAILSYRFLTADRSGPIWGFVPAQLRGPEVRFTPKPPSLTLWWRWKDRDSGTCSTMMYSPMFQAKFSRLDG